jgi:hypothetical protein
MAVGTRPAVVAVMVARHGDRNKRRPVFARMTCLADLVYYPSPLFISQREQCR